MISSLSPLKTSSLYEQAPRTLDLTRNVQRADGRQEERPSVNGLRQALVNGNHDSSAASPSSTTRSPRNGEENWQEVVSPVSSMSFCELTT